MQESSSEHDRYYTPGVTSYDPDLSDRVDADGRQIADQLAQGDCEPLPGKVLELLDLHTQACNVGPIGLIRAEIAEFTTSVEPPTPGHARQVGGRLLELLEMTTDVGIVLSGAQMDNTDLWT